MTALSTRGSVGTTVASGDQLRPPLREAPARMATAGSSDDRNAGRPLKYTVPSPPAETHGSEAASYGPPVQRVSPESVTRSHVLPPSRDVPIRSLRAAKPRSCCHVATMLRGSAGLTVIEGSISAPATCVSSRSAPGHPAANGLGPEIAFTSFTLYAGPWPGGAPLAAAAKTALPKTMTRKPAKAPSRIEPPPPVVGDELIAYVFFRPP